MIIDKIILSPDIMMMSLLYFLIFLEVGVRNIGRKDIPQGDFPSKKQLCLQESPVSPLIPHNPKIQCIRNSFTA